MKRLFDVMCSNENCSEHGIPVEVLIHEGEFPVCEICGERTGITITKTPSVRLVGGTSAGFYNDGFLNTGKQKGDTRSVPV